MPCMVWWSSLLVQQGVWRRGLIDGEEDMLVAEALGYSRDNVHFWVIPESRFTSGLFQK